MNKDKDPLRLYVWSTQYKEWLKQNRLYYTNKLNEAGCFPQNQIKNISDGRVKNLWPIPEMAVKQIVAQTIVSKVFKNE